MRIRKIREDDIGEVVRIIHETMSPKDAKSALSDIQETMSRKHENAFKFEEFYVVEINKKIAGGGGIWALKHDPYIARLDWFIVDPNFQRKGLGTMLLKELENNLLQKKAKLILAETSSGKEYKAATIFWTKNGFKEIAKIPGYWEDGSACLLFMKRIGQNGSK